MAVSVPSSGDYQFLQRDKKMSNLMGGFRPLIRGLSISSACRIHSATRGYVSVPSSGDYQFLRYHSSGEPVIAYVSVPSSGDYQFLPDTQV